MEASASPFDHAESARRIREILAIPDNAYVEKDSIPPRDNLTFDNGFYVYCAAVFVDLRGSKKLAGTLSMPALARLNRVFVSEMVAVLRDHDEVREVFIEGDCVWAIYDTPYQPYVERAFSRCYSAASLVKILNHYLIKNNLKPLKIGVGIDYGRALMIKAGHKGSGINEIVWTGKVVGRAAELCSFGNQEFFDEPIMVSEAIYSNLNERSKSLLSWNVNRQCWHGNVINTEMDSWLKAQG